MSLSRAGFEQQRLFPEPLEERLIGVLGRSSGVALIGLVAALWLSLLTWVLSDPSLTHTTGGPTRNALGAVGAVAADLLLQTLGLAAAVVLLAPMFWAMELIADRRVSGFRFKAAFFPVSVLVLAGALSSLPTNAGWPLHHGFGGIMGDVVFNFGAGLFGLINPDRATSAAGVLLFAGGLSALVHSIGLEVRDLAAILRQPRAADGWRETAGTWQHLLWKEAKRLGQGIAARSAAAVGAYEPELPGGFASSRGGAEDGRAATCPLGPRIGALEDDRATPIERTAHRTNVGTGGYDDWMAPHEAAAVASGEADFDTDTDRASRAIAERFAPPGTGMPTPPRAAPGGPDGPRTDPPRREPPPAQPAPKPRARMPGVYDARRPDPHYKRPSINMLKRPAGARPGPEFTQTVLRGNARLLEDVLGDFGVKGEVKDIKPGPVVTLFEMEPARGTKSSRVISLADDIARSMSATSVRVAVVPGRNVIGIELPNMRREPVLLREILEAEAFRSSDAALPLCLGKSIGGEPVVADLARMPHLLVAGTTGSGKSVGVNAMVLSLLYRHSPEDCRFLMIDPKMLELSVYNGVPHLLCPVVTDPLKAVAALNWAVAEMEERYKRMAKLSVRNIDVYNNRVRNAKKRGELIARTVQTGFDRRTGEAVYERQEMDLEPMPYIVVVVDEFADLMIVAGKEIESAVQRLAQMARAAGIHLIMATQRPSVDIITGTIKANFPTRISFKVTSKIDSRTILNDQGAEQLLGQGDMLYSSGSGQTVRVHGPFVADEEVEAIAQFLRGLGEPRYVEGITGSAEEGAGEGRPGLSGDALYDKAVALVMGDRKASTSYLQRRLGIGYNRAADLIERMERDGLISLPNPVGKREILVGHMSGEPDAA